MCALRARGRRAGVEEAQRPRARGAFWLCSLLCALWAHAGRAEAPTASGFVGVQGREFVLEGQPFRFLGANVSVIHGPRERASFEAVLDAVVEDGLKVVRLWALGEQPAPGAPHHPLYAFRIGESGWVEASFEHLDRVLAAASRRGLKVIVVLANRWKDYGGIATYLRWSGTEVARDGQGEPLGRAQAAFFRSDVCQERYREHVQRLVGRTNSVTGVRYRDDPTIMAWELINEASAVSAGEEEALLSWVQDTARFVRSLDPNHLISAGHIGYQTARERNVWRAVQKVAEIDFADAHAYPATDPRVTRLAEIPSLLDDPIALASLDVKKPLIFGEFGFRHEAYRASAERMRWYRAFVRHLAQRGVSGALVWIYEPKESPLRSHTIRSAPDDEASLGIRKLLRTNAALLAAVSAKRLPVSWRAPDALPTFVRPHKEVGTLALHHGFTRDGETYSLAIDPGAYAHLRFERAGVHVGHGVQTVWGAGEGEVTYRFRAPAFVPRRVTIEARVSSELPGVGPGEDLRDGSDVEILLDDQVLGTVRAKPDDGRGEIVRVEVTDPFLLKRLFATQAAHAALSRAAVALRRWLVHLRSRSGARRVRERRARNPAAYHAAIAVGVVRLTARHAQNAS